MNRRHFLQGSFALSLGTPMLAALQQGRLDEAAAVLARATAEGQVASAVLHVVQREAGFTRVFGKAQSADAMFLLGSISKPIAVTALMTLFERGEFKLDDPLKKFMPKVTGGGRGRGAKQHRLTHVSACRISSRKTRSGGASPRRSGGSSGRGRARRCTSRRGPSISIRAWPS